MHVVNVLSAAYDHFCKIIAPPYCAYCRTLIADRSVLCTSCLMLIKPIVSHKIPVLQGHCLVVHALSAYEDPLKSLILRKNNQDPLASVQLGRLMARSLIVKTIKVDGFVPVPLHWSRYARRGFNQAEVIAYELAKECNAPVVSLVKRTKRTIFQSACTGSRRLENVAGAFLLNTNYHPFENKHIVIVDDLMTTGARYERSQKH